MKSNMKSSLKATPAGAAPIAFMGLVVLSVSMVPALGCVSQGQESESQESREFLEILRNARPAPQPSGKVFPEAESGSPESRSLVGYDLVTGRELEPPPSVEEERRSNSAPSKQPQMPQSEEVVLTAPEKGSAIEKLDPDSSMPGQTLLSGSPAPTDPDSRITHNLLMRFDASGNEHFYLCTGFSADGLQISTAGHCLYLHDPDGDGDASDAGWAQEVWAWKSQTDLEGTSLGSKSAPQGAVKAVLLHSYRGWIDRGDPSHDAGYVTLARRSDG